MQQRQLNLSRMKQLFIFTIVVVIPLASCNTLKKTNSAKSLVNQCRDFKTGKFVLEDKSINHRSIITRTSSTQIEQIFPENKEIKFEVNWLNDCKYSLTPAENIPNKMVLIVEIDSIIGSVQHFTMYPRNKEDKKMNFKMTKIE